MSEAEGSGFFISYARTEYDLMVGNVKSVLAKEGLPFWYDEHLGESSEGDQWWEEIVRQIRIAHTSILLFTELWQKSKICQDELHTAQRYGKFILPVLIEQVDILPTMSAILPRYHASMLYERSGRATFLQRLTSIHSKQKGESALDKGDALNVEHLCRLLKDEAHKSAAKLKILGNGNPHNLIDIFLQLTVTKTNAGILTQEEVLASSIFNPHERQLILLLGVPGSGKSTLLQYLQLQTATSDGHLLPIRQSARALVAKGRDVVDWLREYLTGRMTTGAAVSPAGNPVDGARLILFIDGLDEVADANHERILHGINRLIDIYPSISVCISSRFDRLDAEQFSDFMVYTIQGLSDTEIRHYVEKTVTLDRQEQVWNTVVSTPQLLDLCRTPFILLALVCNAGSELGGKAHQRALVYRRCIRYLLRDLDWQTGRTKSTPDEVSDLERILTSLALRFFKLDSSGSFSKAEVLEGIRLIPGFQHDAQATLNTICERTGLLREDRGRVEFIHRSIWEYFVAEGCRTERLEVLVERSNARHWEEPIRLFAGLLDEAQFEVLVKGLWPRNTGLALRVLTEVSAVPRGLLNALYTECEFQDKLRLIQELTALTIGMDIRRQSKVIVDTASILIMIERDAEILFRLYEILRPIGDSACSSVISRMLDTASLPDRGRMFLNDPKFSFRFARSISGDFTIGVDNLSDGRPPDATETPAHLVGISPFRIMTTPVTNALFYSSFPYAEDHRDSYSSEPNQPVNNVTWYEAKMFALWMGCDLPTSAEWESAARNSEEDDRLLNSAESLPDFAWYGDNSDNKTHPVATKCPNSLGIYDVSGNVREWCQDWYDVAYYRRCVEIGKIQDPVGPSRGDRKVLRGGTFDWSFTNLRPTYRNFNVPGSRSHVTGFRLVMRDRRDSSLVNGLDASQEQVLEDFPSDLLGLSDPANKSGGK